MLHSHGTTQTSNLVAGSKRDRPLHGVASSICLSPLTLLVSTAVPLSLVSLYRLASSTTLVR